MRLLEGLDDIGLTLKHTDEIVAFEKRVASAQPWLQTAIASRARSCPSPNAARRKYNLPRQ